MARRRNVGGGDLGDLGYGGGDHVELPGHSLDFPFGEANASEAGQTCNLVN